MQSILAPIDFSNNSIVAVRESIKLAIRCQAKLHIIHVYGALKRADTIMSVNKLLQKDATENLKEMLSSLDIPETLDVTHKAVNGTDIAGTIERIAKQIGADLVVLGSKGEMNDSEVFIGSTPGKLLKRTNTPLLIIPEGKQMTDIDQILFSVKSLTISDPKILDPLRFIKDLFEARVDLLQVEVPGYIEVNAPSEALVSISDSSNQITAPDIYQGIESYRRDHQHDLLCVIRRKRGFFELLFRRSNMMKKSFNAEVPILVLQGSKE